MSEVDFIPAWYRELLQRRRLTFIYGIALVVLVAVLVSGVMNKRRQVASAEQDLAGVEDELAGARAELQKLNALTQLRDQWRRQDKVLATTGVNVEASRLLGALEQVIPPDTALTELIFTVEKGGTDPEASDEAATPATATPDALTSQRRLRVALRGLAPGELAVASLLSGISNTPLFTNVNLSYAKDHEEPGRVGREFEVTFVINLSPAVADQAL